MVFLLWALRELGGTGKREKNPLPYQRKKLPATVEVSSRKQEGWLLARRYRKRGRA